MSSWRWYTENLVEAGAKRVHPAMMCNPKRIPETSVHRDPLRCMARPNGGRDRKIPERKPEMEEKQCIMIIVFLGFFGATSTLGIILHVVRTPETDYWPPMKYVPFMIYVASAFLTSFIFLLCGIIEILRHVRLYWIE